MVTISTTQLLLSGVVICLLVATIVNLMFKIDTLRKNHAQRKKTYRNVFEALGDEELHTAKDLIENSRFIRTWLFNQKKYPVDSVEYKGLVKFIHRKTEKNTKKIQLFCQLYE